MKKIQGDLLKLAKDGSLSVIVHGCNCFHTMGAGIAKQIKREFPEAYNADLGTKRGDVSKLGTISFASKTMENGHTLWIVNAYTQYKYGRYGVYVNYGALRNCFKNIKHLFSGMRIGYPLIGCSLAGGDWNIVSDIIDEELSGEDHTLVVLN